MMYHFGPLQVALCLLHVSIECYRDLKKSDPTLGRVPFDNFLDENTEFVERLGSLRIRCYIPIWTLFQNKKTSWRLSLALPIVI